MYCLVHTVAVDVVVGPGGPVNGNPGGVGLGVEGAGGGVRLIGVDGHGGVAVGLEVGAPGLVGLVPVAGGLGVVPDDVTYRVNLLVLLKSPRLVRPPCGVATDKMRLKSEIWVHLQDCLTENIVLSAAKSATYLTTL